jgi:hypothetical protein
MGLRAPMALLGAATVAPANTRAMMVESFMMAIDNHRCDGIVDQERKVLRFKVVGGGQSIEDVVHLGRVVMSDKQGKRV